MKMSEARAIVEREVVENLNGHRLIDDATKEFSTCFAFYYQNETYLKSRVFRDMSVGAGPVIVCKQTGAVYETGSVHSTNHYIKTFEACGDPLAEMTTHIAVYGCNEGTQKQAAIKLIKEHSGLSLKDAKSIVDKASANEESRFSTESTELSEEVVKSLQLFGFKCKQLWSNQIN